MIVFKMTLGLITYKDYLHQLLRKSQQWNFFKLDKYVAKNAVYFPKLVQL